MSGLFNQLGRYLGKRAVPAIQKTRWVWQNLTGTEEEALRAEAGFGRALAMEVRAAAGAVQDAALAALLEDICRRLSGCVRDRRRRFHCEAIPGEAPNAMALPGGYVFLSLPLATLCGRRPEELAFVIGHEMAHVIRGHAWDRMVEQTAARVASAISLRGGPLGQWVRTQGLGLLQSAHSRDGEREADELGLRLAAAAGYAPAGALALLGRLERLGSEPSGLGQYFGSHPPAAERIARLEPLSRQLAAAPPVGPACRPGPAAPR